MNTKCDAQTEWASQHDGIQGSCSLFDFSVLPCERSLLAGRRRLRATSAQTTGVLGSVWRKYCLVWKKFKVKRLVPQWERRMWEWHLTTSPLSVSQTTKRRKRCLLTLLICHLPTIAQEVRTMNVNVKCNFCLDINWISTQWTCHGCFWCTLRSPDIISWKTQKNLKHISDTMMMRLY